MHVNLIKIAAFGLTDIAAGLAGVIGVSRISMGQPQAVVGMELDATAAVILGGTSIYGGAGAVWRSLVGVLLLSLIGNGSKSSTPIPFSRISPPA